MFTLRFLTAFVVASKIFRRASSLLSIRFASIATEAPGEAKRRFPFKRRARLCRSRKTLFTVAIQLIVTVDLKTIIALLVLPGAITSVLLAITLQQQISVFFTKITVFKLTLAIWRV